MRWGPAVTGERLPRLRSGPRGALGPWRITSSHRGAAAALRREGGRHQAALRSSSCQFKCSQKSKFNSSFGVSQSLERNVLITNINTLSSKPCGLRIRRKHYSSPSAVFKSFFSVLLCLLPCYAHKISNSGLAHLISRYYNVQICNFMTDTLCLPYSAPVFINLTSKKFSLALC